MNIVLKYKITKDSDLLFARIDIINFLKSKNYYLDLFKFAIMELGTNLIKHANGGEIWLLEENKEFILASLDRGEGIEDLDWALKRGNSTIKDSLGLGLFQLSQNDLFDLLIFSSTSTPQGTVIIFKPKKLKNNFIFLQRNYLDMNISGDFFIQKGKYFIVGDSSGHGVLANKTAKFINKYFFNKAFSCILIDDVFKDLDNKLKENGLRSAVISIMEYTKKQINICGVGNIGILHITNSNIEEISQKNGILGEVYHSISKYKFNLQKNDKIVLYSDGVDDKMVYNISKKCQDIYLFGISTIYFSDIMDDKTVFILEGV